MASGSHSKHVITVPGSGRAAGVPDIAEVSLGVLVVRKAARDARADGAQAMTAVVESIKALGIDDRQIRTSGLSLGLNYGRDGEPAGYQFSSNVRVTVKDLAQVASVLDGAVGAGATTVNDVSFRLSDTASLEAEAREKAMADARSRAEQLAKHAGVTLGGVAFVTEGGGSGGDVPRFAMRAMAASASTPIEAGETEIGIDLVVGFSIG